MSSVQCVPDAGAVPHEAMRLHVVDGLTLWRTWRECLGLTQAEVARRMGIPQPAFSQLEAAPASRCQPIGNLFLPSELRSGWHLFQHLLAPSRIEREGKDHRGGWVRLTRALD